MATEKSPQVAVVMGSDSDLKVMESCIEQLREFGVAAEVRIISAHRTPRIAAEFAETAERRGLQAIIAAAGMAAHLAGAMAASSTLPVIGVPLAAEPGIGGLDALLSTVQMPPGVPVATVGIGKPGAKNAAILAVQILARNNPALREKLVEFKRKQAEAVQQKDAGLH
jgi:phosphoribosylaminoimidazole carboxylase PurE protein